MSAVPVWVTTVSAPVQVEVMPTSMDATPDLVTLADAVDVMPTDTTAVPNSIPPVLSPVADAVIATPMLAERVKVEEWSAVTPSTTLMLARGTDVVGTVWVILDDLVNLLGSLVKRLGLTPSLDGAFKPITC